jgi:hypothetical protein
MEPRVLNLSAFGDVIEDPKYKKDTMSTEEPQKALPAPSDVDDFKYMDSPERSLDFRSVIAKNKTELTKENKHGKVVKMVLQNMSQTKLLHWQCQLYGQHIALDELFNQIRKIGDTLIETIMGKYGRPILDSEDLNITLYNFEDAKNGDLSKFIDDLYRCYREECRSHFDEKSDSEIVNIIDEIIAAVDQTKYLISLR